MKLVLFVALMGWVYTAYFKDSGYSDQQRDRVIDDRDGGDRNRDREEIDREERRPVTKMEGVIVYVHDRDPMSKSEQDVVVDTRSMCEKSNGELMYRSVDKRDPSEKVRKIVERAASEGHEPPFAMHKRPDGSLKFVPMVGTFESIKKELMQ